LDLGLKWENESKEGLFRDVFLIMMSFYFLGGFLEIEDS